MSVAEEHGMACPNCGEDGALDITATVQVRLTPDGSDADLSEDGSHEWDEASRCRCGYCGHSDIVANFKKEA